MQEDLGFTTHLSKYGCTEVVISIPLYGWQLKCSLKRM